MDMKVGINNLKSRSIDAVYAVCELLPLNCTFITYNSSEYGSAFDNGTGTGMIGAVQRGEFDTFQPLFTPTYARYRAVDFTHAYFYIDIVIATRSPISNKNGLNLKLVTALRWETWCIFALSMAVVSAILTTVSQKLGNPRMGFSYWIPAIFSFWPALITHKHKSSMAYLNFFRLIIALWSLTAMVIASVYTGLLFSEKLKNLGAVPFKDFDTMVDCVEAEKCQLVTHSPTLSFMQILTSPENTAGQRLSATFKKRPLLQTTSAAEVPKQILDTQDIFLVWLTSKSSFDTVVPNNNDCRFYVVQGPFQDVWGFIVRKRSPLIEILNRGAGAFVERGVAKGVSTKYDKDWGFCTPSFNLAGGYSKLDSGMMKTAFCFLGVGLGICILTLLIEVAKSRF